MTVIEDGNPLYVALDTASLTTTESFPNLPLLSPHPPSNHDSASTESGLTSSTSTAEMVTTSYAPIHRTMPTIPEAPRPNYFNMHRIQQTGELLESVQVAQMTKYELKAVPAIQAILLKVTHVDISEQEKASYQNEPAKENSKR